MRLRRLVVALVIAVATAGVSCGLGVPVPLLTETPREFFPLSPGTLWVYEVRNARGQVALQRVIVRGTRYLETRKTTAAVVEESGGMAGEFDLDVSWHPVAYYRRGDFLYKFSGLSYTGDRLKEYRLGRGEEKVLPADPLKLREWESDFQVFSVGEQSNYAVRATARAGSSTETVAVRAGTFRGCVRVDTQAVAGSESAAVSFHYVDWYAPGVGLVKSQVMSLGERQPITTIELVSFRAGAER